MNITNGNAIEDKSEKKPQKVNMTNIGQILFICFLFVVIFMQTANIVSDAHNSKNGVDYLSDKNNESYGENKNADLPNPSGNNISDQNVNNIEKHDNNAYKNIADTENTENAETIFLLGESGGKLAVFSPDRQTVYEIFDVYINTLPDYDKNLLLDGIQIKTPEQLYSLLEDYSS